MRWERDREREREKEREVLLRAISSKTPMLPLKKHVFYEYWLFCSRFITFTFDLCDRLFFVCGSQTLAKTKYHYYVDQSELLTRFWTDLTSSVRNFWRWGADVPPGETSLAGRGEERWLFSQGYREEKSSPHVAMVAKFLDDNKLKIHLKSKFALL